MKQRVAIIIPPILPVPAVKGGAVEDLVNLLIDENEIQGRVDLTIVSIYDRDAYKQSCLYKTVRFKWIKLGSLRKILHNRLHYHVFRPLFHKPFLNYWQSEVIRIIKEGDYDRVILEDNPEFINALGEAIGPERLFSHIHVLRDMEAHTFDKCSAVIAVSDFVKKEIHKIIGEKDIRVLRNSIDERVFHKDDDARREMRKTLGLVDEEKAICYVGRIVEPKGVKQLVQAFTMLDIKDNCKLYLFGSLGGLFKNTDSCVSPFAQELLTLAAPQKDRIVFAGYVDNNQLPSYLNAMDIAVMPSLYPETCAVNNIEYQAVGLPVITTNSGGIPEFVSDKAIVMDAAQDLVPQIVGALSVVLNSKTKRDEMKDASLEYAKHFSRKEYYDAFVKVI